jgi:glutathione S-transferase
VRILYHLPLSPFARKVRLALAEKRIPFELRVERVWERRPEFLEMNAACTVPVLQEPNGLAIAWFDGKFATEVTRNLLFEKQMKRLLGRGNPDASAIRAGYQNLKPHLEYIGWLAETRAWLAGPQISLADFAAAAQLSALDYIGDIDWSMNEAAKEWYARCKSRPCFRALLAERVSGVTPPAHYADLDF